MEIWILHCYIVINCAFIIPSLKAKPFSLNEAFATGSKLQKKSTTQSPITKERGIRFSLNEADSLESLHRLQKYKEDKDYSRGTLTGVKLPLLKSRKFRKNRDLLKIKTLKDLFPHLHKGKAQSKKRDINKHHKHDKKNFPLFKNLGLLFNHLLVHSGESHEIAQTKLKRKQRPKDEEFGAVCPCANKTDVHSRKSRTNKKTIISAKALSFEKSPATASPSTLALGDISRFGQNKSVPLLLSRDSSGSWGDDHGFGQRSNPAFHRSIKGDFARNIGNRKYYTRNGEQTVSPESNGEDTDIDSRNYANGNELRGRGRGSVGERNNTSHFTENETDDTLREKTHKVSRKTKFQIRRNETESQEFVRKPFRRVRGSLSKNKIGNITKPLQPEENNAEGFDNDTINNTSFKRIFDRSSSSSREDQEISSGDEAEVSVNDLSNLDLALRVVPKGNAPSVTIFDGYSVARDKNGQNRLTEKSIRIHAVE